MYFAPCAQYCTIYHALDETIVIIDRVIVGLGISSEALSQMVPKIWPKFKVGGRNLHIYCMLVGKDIIPYLV